MPKLVVGIITYGESTAKYLPFFLRSLKEQNYQDFVLLAFDNTDDGSDVNRSQIENSGLAFEIFAEQNNLGFGKAYNVLIKRSRELGADFFLLLNIDMILDSAMIFSLVSFIEGSPSTGAVMPKILKWNFNDEEKTNIIDSLGVTTDKYLRFFDHFQGQVDDKQIVIPTDIFGFTGAAALLRLSSLEKIKYGDEYFDESMFMYKEDCDLSLRIRLAGFRIMVEPAALAYHDRTAAAPGNRLALIAANRKNKSRQVKKWSFLNQLIIVYKFSHLLPVGIKLGAWTYQFLSTIYAIFFETYLVKELGAFIRLRHQIKLRSTAMPIAISKEQIGNIFK